MSTHRIEVYGPNGELLISEPVIEAEDTHMVRTLKPSEIAVERKQVENWRNVMTKAKRTISDLTLYTRQLGWGNVTDRIAQAIDEMESALKSGNHVRPE